MLESMIEEETHNSADVAGNDSNPYAGHSSDMERYVSHEINIALEMLFKEPNQTILKLRVPIPVPSLYPWEYFLKLNFNPRLPHLRHLHPYRLTAEHFTINGEVDESHRPRTYLALFQFLEYVREQLEWIEDNIPIVEEKFRHFKFRAKQMLDYQQVDRKQLQQNIQNTLVHAYNVVSQRALLKNIYENLVSRVNSEINARREVNLRKIYGIQTIEKEFSPDYELLLGKVQLILVTRQRLQKILDNWKNIRLPSRRQSSESEQ
ncbi:MAG: hypothetical protein KDK34_16615 [Leptospiraceae bacterium]|nr:hypothetical protein [Leptospiraceae bacterium]MCB1321881.1 hypothetical protein [Leptospiraceae bacterium]